MAHLHSPSIVQYYGYCLEKPNYCIVMEYMPKGSLYKVLHSHEILSWENRYKIIYNIATGLAFLHSEDILHRDLKSLNILLDENYRAKLTDFGLAKLKVEGSVNSESCEGSTAWKAPEIISGKASSKKSDVYSLGVTLFEIASRKIPFEKANGNEQLIMRWVSNAKRDDIPSDCPPKLAKLIEWCWSQEASKRPTANNIVNYLKNEITEINSLENTVSLDNLDNGNIELESGPHYQPNSSN